MTLNTTLQESTTGSEVSLFRLDATKAGGGIYFMTQAARLPDTGLPRQVVFGGQAYTPIDLSFTDFQVTGSGSLPTPKLQIANSDEMIQAVSNTYGDLQGCEIRRVRTFDKYLDDGESPDPTAFIGPDVFLIERKSSDNPLYIEWELSAAIDQEGKKLPGRVVLRDTCTFRYRVWAGIGQPGAAPDGFIYPKSNPCPYTGTAYFDALGNPTDAAHDRCGRRLSDCFKRFPKTGPCPFGAFPGSARVKG
jgi:lambda family phage minor tail protein L